VILTGPFVLVTLKSAGRGASFKFRGRVSQQSLLNSAGDQKGVTEFHPTVFLAILLHKRRLLAFCFVLVLAARKGRFSYTERRVGIVFEDKTRRGHDIAGKKRTAVPVLIQ